MFYSSYWFISFAWVNIWKYLCCLTPGMWLGCWRLKVNFYVLLGSDEGEESCQNFCWEATRQFVFVDYNLLLYIMNTSHKLGKKQDIFFSFSILLNGIEWILLPLGWQLSTLTWLVEFICVPPVIHTCKIIKCISLSKMHVWLIWKMVLNVLGSNLLQLIMVLSMQKHNVLENFIWGNLYNIWWSANQ